MNAFSILGFLFIFTNRMSYKKAMLAVTTAIRGSNMQDSATVTCSFLASNSFRFPILFLSDLWSA